MKNLFLISFLSLAITYSFAQKHPTIIIGTVPIDENVSMKQTEVTIEEWMDFIINNNFDSSLFPEPKGISPSVKILFEDLMKGKDFEYLQIVDSRNIFKQVYGNKRVEPSKKFKDLQNKDTNYFSLKIPITGITFEQASKYCEWKENIINQNRKVQIKISLPSIDIYKKVITNIDSICRKKCDTCNKPFINCKLPKCPLKEKEKIITTEGQGVIRVDAYWPNKFNLYCLQGNAAEMTSTKGIAMGGSFRQYARESYNDQTQPYSKAEDWIGFRYIVTLR